jgi:hypothetical protein
MSIDPTGTFLLTNGRSGPSKALSSANDPKAGFISLKDIDGTARQQWFFVPVGNSQKYRMHTVARGQNASLDVLNNKGASGSVFLHFTPTQDVSGQVWTASQVSANVYRFTNDFTGSQRPLGGFKKGFARLINSSIGVNDAQLWTLSRFSSATAPPASSTTTESAAAESESPDPVDTSQLPTFSPPPQTSSATPTPAAPSAVASIAFPDPSSVSIAAVAASSPSPTSAASAATTSSSSRIPDDDPDNDPDNDPDSDPDVSTGGSNPVQTNAAALPPGFDGTSTTSLGASPASTSGAADLSALPVHHGLSREAIAAIVIGTTLFACALAFGAYFGWKFLRRRLADRRAERRMRILSRPDTPEMRDGFGIVTNAYSTNSPNGSSRRIDLDTTAVSQQSMMLFGLQDSREPSAGRDVEVGRVIPSVSDGSSVSFRWDRRSYAHF